MMVTTGIEGTISMQLIDELKTQAKTVLRGHENVTGINEALLEYRRSEVIDGLVKIHKYLNSIIEQLHIIQPDVKTTCQISDVCTIDGLRQKNYRQFFEHTFNELTLGITFTLECGKNCSVTNIKTADHEKVVNRLQKFGLDVDDLDKNRISVDGQFSASFVFRSNFNEQLITLLIKNVETTDQHCYELRPENITDRLLNELGNYLLCNDNSFIDVISKHRKSIHAHTSSKKAESNEQDQTEMLQQPRLNGITNSRKQLYLTYHENIQEINSLDNELILGRGNICNMLVPSEFASRKHARIVFRRGKFVISDHSTNGTFIKIQGNKEVYIHGEDYPLSGTGFISLGESTTIDNDHLIYFTCQ